MQCKQSLKPFSTRSISAATSTPSFPLPAHANLHARSKGFGSDISVAAGSPIDFKIKTDATQYRIDIYRSGYYGGLGARLVDSFNPSAKLPQQQPPCLTDNTTRLYDCGTWHVSATWRVPPDAVSGVYFARLVRTDEDTSEVWREDHSPFGPDPRFSRPGPLSAPAPEPHSYGALGYGNLRNRLREARASHIFFVVRNEDSHSEVLFQTSDTTWQAYNTYGGACSYGNFDLSRPTQRAYLSSYNRPLETRKYRPINAYLGAEYSMVRFLERNGYDVSYWSGLDTHRFGKERLNRHKLFLSVGHDEYWSGQQRANVERARDSGLNLAFLSGNEMFWRIRWEDSKAGGSEGDLRTLVCYKDTQEVVKQDPEPDEWTGTFRDGRDINPLGAQPENAVTGTIYTVNSWRNDPLAVPWYFSKMRVWRHTRVAQLHQGEVYLSPKGILGHEWDEDINNGFRPRGLIRMSETSVDNLMYIQDQGSLYDSGSATHSLTMYRSSSGSLVFGAGTVQWTWGLDDHHDSETGVPAERANVCNIRVGVDPHGADPTLQQATVNIFADMEVLPTTPLGHLVVDEPKSLVGNGPSSRVSRVFGSGVEVEVEVEVSDVADGAVAGIVEVSLDGGDEWNIIPPSAMNPIQMSSSSVWRHTFRLDDPFVRLSPEASAGKLGVMARATDDRANCGPNSATVAHVAVVAVGVDGSDEL